MRSLLFSVVMFGTALFPAWRITQPASDESNSWVKNLGKGVGEASRVGVGAGVSVKGIGVGGTVADGKSGATDVGVADWQAVMKRRHPRRSFFIMLIKTQLPALYAGCTKGRTIVYEILNTIIFSKLIAIRNTQKTRHLVEDDAAPHERDEDQKDHADQEADGPRYKAVACLHIPHHGHQDEEECRWQKPQDAK